MKWIGFPFRLLVVLILTPLMLLAAIGMTVFIVIFNPDLMDRSAYASMWYDAKAMSRWVVNP